MDLVEVDVVGLEPPETGFARGNQVLPRKAILVRATVVRVVGPPPSLRRDDQIVARLSGQPAPENLLGDAAAVDVSRIDESCRRPRQSGRASHGSPPPVASRPNVIAPRQSSLMLEARAAQITHLHCRSPGSVILVVRQRMPRLVEAESTAARRADRRQQPPPLVVDRPAGDTLLAEPRDLGVHVIAHQIELMAAVRLAGMERHLGGRHGEDQPSRRRRPRTSMPSASRKQGVGPPPGWRVWMTVCAPMIIDFRLRSPPAVAASGRGPRRWPLHPGAAKKRGALRKERACARPRFLATPPRRRSARPSISTGRDAMT